MKRFLAGFYCGGSVSFAVFALSFGASLARALLVGAIWPYYTVQFVLCVFFGV